MPNDNAPHSIVYWFRWEIHERNMRGQLSGSPVDGKDFRGVLHYENREEAKNNIDHIVNQFKEELHKCLNQNQQQA